MVSAKRPVVLLVNDDPRMLDLLEVEFAEAGFDVVIAGQGFHALAEVNTNWHQFSAVITDIRLDPPGIDGPDGWEVARRARELSTEMPIVYLDGASAHQWPSKGVPNSVVVAKPFVVGELIAAVTVLLAEADRAAAAQPQI
jgi:DNA-binding response OmpR family regulator